MGGEVNAMPSVRGGHAQGERHMCFPHTGLSQEQGDAVLGDELKAREFPDLGLIDGGIEAEVERLEGDQGREARLFEAKLQCVLFSRIELAR